MQDRLFELEDCIALNMHGCCDETYTQGMSPQVSWDDSMSSYNAVELRNLFARHGDVQEVICRPTKKKKGSALVVMGDVQVRTLYKCQKTWQLTWRQSHRRPGMRCALRASYWIFPKLS